jgi:hypothetical protein
VGFDITDQLLIKTFLHSSQTLEKNGGTMKTVHQLFVNFKKAYDRSTVRRVVLYNILTEFGV